MTAEGVVENFEDLVFEKRWRRCAPAWDKGPDALLEGFAHFCSEYWSIRHPERGKIPFELREAQVETIELWLRERFTLVLKARQIGFTTLIATYCFWLTYFYPDRSVIIISKTEREATKLLLKSKYGYRFLPEWMKLRGPIRIENTQTKLTFSNESGIESLPSASDPGRGESTFLVVVDEIGFLPNGEQAYASIEPIADVGGRIIMLGSANGEGNLLHQLWIKAQKGENRYKTLFHPWSAGDRDDDWYASQKAELPAWQLSQEYPSDPDEAFLRSGNPVFDVDTLRAIDATDPRVRGFLWKPEDRSRELVPDGGALAVWEFPVPKQLYVIGADVAEGLEHGDFSCAYVLDARHRQVVAVYHAHVDSDLFGSEVLAHLGHWYNLALVAVESNNHGLTTLKALQREQYPNIYRQHRMAQRFEQHSEMLGWRTTRPTKALAIDELNKELRENPTLLADADTITELKTFVREGNGQMHGSPYDDRTMALAIAVQMLKFAFQHEYRPNEKPGPGTAGWYVEKFFPEKDQRHKRIRIGQYNVVRNKTRGRIGF